MKREQEANPKSEPITMSTCPRRRWLALLACGKIAAACCVFGADSNESKMTNSCSSSSLPFKTPFYYGWKMPLIFNTVQRYPTVLLRQLACPPRRFQHG